MILLIDNYDSFTYNLVQRIGELDVSLDLRVIRNDKITADQAVALELNKARNLPPRMREQIATGVQEALPEGFEELVGTYYKALSATQHEQVAP